MFDIFWRFFILGVTSFGGPAAHIGYFRQVFVEQLNWLTDKHYGQLVALSQFLPGPGSSQVGFAIGLHKGGLLGGISAFIAFTLPSFILLYSLAIGLNSLQVDYWQGLIHGLKLLALVIVLDATIKMWQSFCKTTLTRLFALLTALLLFLLPSFYTQIVILVVLSLIGSLFLAQDSENKAQSLSFSLQNKLWLLLMISLFIFSFFHFENPFVQLFNQFFQAGSLVFGGGHVVLPLLQQTLGNVVSEASMLTAYAAAQAVPGPMFTMASFLGAEMQPNAPFMAALTATLAIFLPGFLLTLALHSQWQVLANRPKVAGAIIAINASVVGFLISTLITPIMPSALVSWPDFIMAVIGFVLLRKTKISLFILIILAMAYGVALKIML